jgi:transposase
MTRPPDLRRLSELQKDVLIRDLWAMVQERDALIADLCKRVAELESKLGGPPKTPANSSVPPSQGQKANIPPGKARAGNKRGKGHGRGGRRLHRDPDQRVAARVTSCPHCAAALGGSEQTLHALYDKIELPRPAPIVTRVALYAACCPRCGARVVAPAPAGLEPGSPFGLSIEALAVYLRYQHAISYKRLSKLFEDLHGLKISQGALAGLFQRVKPSFDAQVSAILPACGKAGSSVPTRPGRGSRAATLGSGCSETRSSVST